MPYSGDAAMRSQSRELVQSLHFPEPFSLQALVQSVADHVGETIHLRPLPAALDPRVSGIVVRTHWGYACYQLPLEVGWYGTYCVSHELGHVLRGHFLDTADMVTSAVITIDDDEPAEPAAIMASMMPVTQEARRAWGPLYRCTLTGRREKEAEMVATEIMLRIDEESGQTFRASTPSSRDNDVRDRLTRILGPKDVRWR